MRTRFMILAALCLLAVPACSRKPRTDSTQEEAAQRRAEEETRQEAAKQAASPQKTSDGRFVDNGDGTVIDTRTGLMWATRDNGKDISWDDAEQYCRNCRAGGHSDWRMPAISELQGLYDQGCSQGISCGNDGEIVCVTPLIDITCSWVWSSEKDSPSTARPFAFLLGLAGSHPRSDSHRGRALPVRSQ